MSVLIGKREMSQQKHGIPKVGLILVGGLVLFSGFSIGLDMLYKRIHLGKTEQVDFYQQALTYGMQAAIAAQTAETYQEWATVSSLWSQAIGKLQSVPKQNPNYAAVREKIVEYRTNQEYAQKVQQLKSN